MSGCSGTSLTWRCPERSPGLRHLPLDTYEEILAWLRPIRDADVDMNSYHQILACLAPVCRFFAYYATRQVSRSLDLKGVAHCSSSWKPTGTWCPGIIKRFQSMETLRTAVKECKIHDWYQALARSPNISLQIVASTLSRFLSRLDSLGKIKVSTIPISYMMLQTIGRLPSLRKLEIVECYLDLDNDCPSEAMFGINETPFPVLQQLTIGSTHPKKNPVFEEALCALGRATTLRSLALTDSDWLHFFLPHISPHIISVSGNFAAVPMDMFLRFIKSHAALRDLTVHFQTHERYPFYGVNHKTYTGRKQRLLSYAALNVDEGDLPDLRSFSGPFTLAPEFIRDRSVTRLALGSHLRSHRYTPSLFGFTVFPHTHSTMVPAPPDYASHMDDNHYVWNSLKIVGGGIRALFFPIDPTAITTTLLSSCFPNLVQLELQLRMWDSLADDPTTLDYLPKLEDILNGFKSLECLTFSGRMHYPFSFWLSAGDQHDFIHRICPDMCPKLRTVAIGPWMIWHLRTPPMGMRACSCELELLLPIGIRTELRWLAQTPRPQQAMLRDWNGKIAGAFSGDPLGMGVDVQRIFML